MTKKIPQTIKIIMVDVDGTLLSNDHTISEANQATLSSLSHQDVYFVMNTGALPTEGYKILTTTKLGINKYTKWFVGLNGVVVYNFLTNNSYCRIIPQNKTKIKAVFEKMNFKNYAIIKLEQQFFCHFTTNDFETWYKLIFEIYPFLEKDSDKLLGLKNCLLLINYFDHVALTKTNILYFGDQRNDLPVFNDSAVYCVAMENAIREIKDLATAQTSNNYQGISDYLEKIKSAS